MPLEGRPDIATTFALRDYIGTRRVFESEAGILQIAEALAARGEAGARVSYLAAATRFHPLRVERILLWLAKYHFVKDTL